MKNLSATVKGLITGITMILLSLAIYSYAGNFENNLQYVVYAVYVGGIIWTLSAYKDSDAASRTFKAYFSQGFKCFIMITLLMVVFTWVFLKMNPSIEAEMAKLYREELLKKGNYTMAEIDSTVATAKQFFTVTMISAAIFGYLFIGALVTAIASFFFSRQSQTNNK